VLAVGVAVGNTGLMYRVALAALGRRPAGFASRCITLGLVGTAVTPTLPNATSRTALAAPMVREIAEALGFEPGGRAATGLALAALIGFGQMAGLFLTGSSVGLLVHGLLPDAVRGEFGFAGWFIAALPLHLLLFAGGLSAVVWLYRPTTAAENPGDRLALQRAVLGPMRADEKLCLAVLVGLIAGFLTEPWHGINGAWLGVGALVALALAGAPGKGQPATSSDAERADQAARWGNFLFLPALIVPGVALGGTFLLPRLGGLVDPKQVTLISLGLGAIIATAVLLAWFRPPASAAVQEGRRLAEGVGWAMILPQLLASLGALFAVAGVGDIVGALAPLAIPEGSRLAAVLAFTGGMAVFTMLMGNAFAAFPVMMGGIGLPVLVAGLGGDPVVIGAVGMLAGFCGTLLSPMAANFNIVPAALLELSDRYAVIKAQWPTAVALWLFNTGMIWGFAFR